MSKQTVAALVKQLRNAADAYYETATSLMSDAAYDALVDNLRSLAPEHLFFSEVGATPTVGVVALPVAMPSLDKRKPESFKALAVGKKVVISDKLDGISALWVTGYSATPQLLLRGNGLQGQDVTSCAKGIQGLGSLAVPKALIRGELIVPKGVLPEGTLARNWVNGQLHQKTPNLDELRKIRFVAYQVCGSTPLTRSQQMTWLANQGFETCWWVSGVSPSLEHLQGLFKSRRAESKYECDGLVVGEDQVPAEVKGASNPSDAFAFKMAVDDQRATTVVREIEWASSRTGNWVPRLRFDPVKIGTATIEYCTGIHAKCIKENRLGPGARVVIRRSGDVIPCLDQVLEPAATWSEPPAGRWTWDATETHAVDTTEEATPEKLALEMAHSLVCLGVEGISKVTAKKLVEAGYKTLKQVWDAPVAGLQAAIGPGNGQKLFDALRGMSVAEDKWMRAYCGWPKGFGETRIVATLAVEADVSKWSGLTKSPKGQSAEAFAEVVKAVPGYLAWRKQFGSVVSVASLASLVSKPAVVVATKGTYGMTGFRDAELQEKLAAAGWVFKESVTAATTFLLVADGAKETTKVAAARKAGVRIVARSEASALL
jgi:NAD-dependent DNA ligase